MTHNPTPESLTDTLRIIAEHLELTAPATNREWYESAEAHAAGVELRDTNYQRANTLRTLAQKLEASRTKPPLPDITQYAITAPEADAIRWIITKL